jgi:propanediol utilization protein
MSGY